MFLSCCTKINSNKNKTKSSVITGQIIYIFLLSFATVTMTLSFLAAVVYVDEGEKKGVIDCRIKNEVCGRLALELDFRVMGYLTFLNGLIKREKVTCRGHLLTFFVDVYIVKLRAVQSVFYVYLINAAFYHFRLYKQKCPL